MHVQLDNDNAIKMTKISQATNRSVGELVNAVLDAVDDVKYFEELKFKVKTDDDVAPKKRIFKHQRNWIQRF
jgi:hypothetical protein